MNNMPTITTGISTGKVQRRRISMANPSRPQPTGRVPISSPSSNPTPSGSRARPAPSTKQLFSPSPTPPPEDSYVADPEVEVIERIEPETSIIEYIENLKPLYNILHMYLELYPHFQQFKKIQDVHRAVLLTMFINNLLASFKRSNLIHRDNMDKITSTSFNTLRMTFQMQNILDIKMAMQTPQQHPGARETWDSWSNQPSEELQEIKRMLEDCIGKRNCQLDTLYLSFNLEKPEMHQEKKPNPYGQQPEEGEIDMLREKLRSSLITNSSLKRDTVLKEQELNQLKEEKKQWETTVNQLKKMITNFETQLATASKNLISSSQLTELKEAWVEELKRERKGSEGRSRYRSPSPKRMKRQ